MATISRRFTIFALGAALFAIALSAAVMKAERPSLNHRVTLTCNAISANKCMAAL